MYYNSPYYFQGDKMLNQEQTQILEQAIFLLFRLRNDQSVENWEEKNVREFLHYSEDFEN